MLPAISLFLIFTIPPLLIWLLLSRLTRISGVWRLAASGLLVSILYSTLLMRDDAAEGFCCREYHATIWTEMPFYTLLAFAFALVCCLTLAAVVSLASLFRK